MKQFLFFIAIISLLALPLTAQDTTVQSNDDATPKIDTQTVSEKPKIDEQARAELDAAKKKLDTALAEFNAVQEKIKAARGESAGKEGAAGKQRPDMSTLAGQTEMFKNMLGLNEEQTKKIQAYAEKGQKEIDTINEKNKSAAESLEAERVKDVPDLKKLRSYMEKTAQAKIDTDLLRLKFSLDCQAVFTPEQLTKYKELKKKMEERMKGGRPGQGMDNQKKHEGKERKEGKKGKDNKENTVQE